MRKILTLIFIIICLAGMQPAAAWAKSVTLTFAWQQATADTTDPTFGGWKLYGKTSPAGSYELLATIPFVAQATEYTSAQPIISPDGSVTTWTFVMTAFDQAGNESAYSETVSWTADFQAPSVPINLKITVQAAP